MCTVYFFPKLLSYELYSDVESTSQEWCKRKKQKGCIVLFYNVASAITCLES